uniref:Uncharacterized protein n=1 Tax=Nelumbo nucifera TaxID=4432 RepID=A0A822Y1M5_NELNU|nr:TPA_asm: hypothetical protein HUJ06_026875 [Nelumbo nucifera]
MAYLKAKDAAERFQLFQFAVCPFTIESSKVVAYPYNFHLFPRDELNIGMPSYSFSCQTSYLMSMAREDFDFNACIYDGISYLSRVQESTAKDRIGNPISSHLVKSSSTSSVADVVFVERIKARVRHWRNACKEPNKGTDELLVKSLRKLILGGELYGSRPCMSIDVCNARQVQLVLEMLSEIFDDLVPLIIPDKSGGPKAVRVVFTSSPEDKNLLEKELENIEEEWNKQVRGFREVIDVLSASQKPIIAFDCLNEFTFVHSKFIAPLPSNLNEFMCSLRLVFPCILDVNNLLKEIGPVSRAKNLPAAMSYLKRQFFVPLDMEIPHQGQPLYSMCTCLHIMLHLVYSWSKCSNSMYGFYLGISAEENERKKHGHNVLRITHLFAKLGSILKITHGSCKTMNGDIDKVMEDHGNIFYPCCSSLKEPIDRDILVFTNKTRKVSTEDLVFLWGFRVGMTAGVLKKILYASHDVFSEDFEVKLVDKSCAVVVFWTPGLAEVLLKVISSGGVGSSALMDMISEGLKAAGYEAYKRVCRMRLWELHLADSLDKALSDEYPRDWVANARSEPLGICWNNEFIIKLDDL